MIRTVSSGMGMGRAPMRVALACVVALAGGAALAGCRTPGALAGMLSSDEAVAQAVLDGLARRDADALMRLAVSREEFERVVWPTLPASRPDVGMPGSYVWQDTAARSRAHLDRTLRQWGGRRLALVRLEFAGETTTHHAYALSRRARLVVRDEAGAQQTLRLFGSIIRQRGGSKVYSYIVD